MIRIAAARIDATEAGGDAPPRLACVLRRRTLLDFIKVNFFG
jgi:hypothetical protein